ncbi:MAG: zinc-binding dehydrogenase [Deltaproteobacteria bacterium]|jgi:threonine dehydrogenase-like Zn-dependent dehydrogenase|nr:zinc-binding dehydrogenase [Deltaproteobacteria bacterium]
MKAYAITGQGKTGWVDLPPPTPGPLDVILKPTALCPCTSDIHIVDTLPPEYAHIIGRPLGHEGIGIVEEVGSEVKKFKAGDHVAGLGMFLDYRSEEAQAGLAQYDPFGSYPDRLYRFGGTFAEHIHVYDADANLALIPDNVTPIQAVMVTDMMSTPFTQAEQANIQYGDSVAVLGIGPVGLMGICAALLKGAGRVLAIGSRKACFDKAKIYGATDLINYHDGDLAEQVLEKNKGPVDVVLVCGGTSSAIGDALRMVKQGGTISNVALFWGEENTVLRNQDWGYGCVQFKTITGTQVKGGSYFIKKLLNLVSYGRVDPSHLASQIFHGFDSIEKAYQAMSVKTPDLIKPVVLI